MNRTIFLNGTEVAINKSVSKKYSMSYRSMPALNKVVFNVAKIRYGDVQRKAREFLEKKRNLGVFNNIGKGGWLYIFGVKKKLNVVLSDKTDYIYESESLFVTLDEKKICDAGNNGDEYCRRLNSVITDFYKTALKTKLSILIGEEEKRIGVTCSDWGIRPIGSAWGKCNPKNKKIVFSLNLALFDERCIRMVIDHELAHILYPDHGKNFHAFMKKNCPDYKKINAYLNR